MIQSQKSAPIIYIYGKVFSECFYADSSLGARGSACTRLEKIASEFFGV